MKKTTQKKLLIVVMDGVGVRKDNYGNAVNLAYTPNLEFLRKNCFYTELKAHGPFVGLPSNDDMGNSEVGHNAIGAGRVFSQGASLVAKAIKEGSLFRAKKWKQLMQGVVSQDKTLHFLGLLSDGNVHSHENHLYAMIKQAVKEGAKKIKIHCLLDGRDVPPQSAEIYLNRLEELIKQVQTSSSNVQIASLGGRMQITMDRYNADWGMVKRGWDAHVGAKGPGFSSALKGLETLRRDNPGIIDQDLPPFVVKDSVTQKPQAMEDGDTVVLFNFRGDRSIEISQAFEDKSFDKFLRDPAPSLNFYGMTEYDGDLKIPKNFLVSPPLIDDTLGEYICSLGLKQFACSETQKYGHVTYFWNGNRSGYFDKKLEYYQEIPSDNISFNKKPWMKAHEICEATIAQMQTGSFDVGRINFPNGDMVGHTGDLAASVCAMTVVDLMLGRLIDTARATKTQLIITADHGNCEEMFQSNSQKILNPVVKTSHTLSPVPLYVFDPTGDTKAFKPLAKDPSLANIANTVLYLMGQDQRDLYLDSILQ